MDRKILIQELSEGLAGRKDIPLKDAELFVRSVFEIVEEYLQTDKLVKIKGFGTFKLVRVDSRESVDVNTGERIVINGYTKVSFTPDTALRDEINKPFAQFETVILYEDTDLSEMEKIDLQETNDQAQNEGEDDENGTPDSIDSDGVENNDVSESVPQNEADDDKSDIKEEDQSATEEQPVANEVQTISDEVEESPREDGDAPEINSAVVSAKAPEKEVELQSGDIEHDEIPDSGLTDQHHEAESENAAEEVAEGSDQEQQPENEVAENQEDPVMDKSGSQNQSVESSATEVQQVEYLHTAYQHVDHQETADQHIRRQKVEEQSAEKQNIEVQHVENQTVENQHIVQVATGKKRRRVPPVWLMVLSVLVVLLLMLGSYFIGYYRLLCPGGCSDLRNSESSHLVADGQERSAADTVKVVNPDKESVAKDSNKISSINKTKQSDVDSNKDKPLNEKKINASDESKAKSNPQQKNFDKLYPQLKGGRYQIVGTKQVHQLQSGETLRHLALRYYGSKSFVPYIVVYNHITNPDVVPVGQKLKLPELRQREQ